MGERLPDERLGKSRRRWMEWLASPHRFWFLAGLSALLVVFSILGGVYLFGRLERGAGQEIDEPPRSLDDLAVQYPELAGILQDGALDSIYKAFLIAYQDGGEAAALDLARQRGMLNSRDELVFTLELDTDATSDLANELQVRGVRVTAMSGRWMDIAVPWGLIVQAAEAGEPDAWLAQITGLEHVIHLRLPAPGAQDSQGLVETEALATIGADAWHAAGWSGKGVKVGIIDSGFGRYTEFLGSELPDQVMARSFVDGMDQIDQTDVVHGTACAEIIHDLAPGAELYLAAANSQTETMLAADWLKSQGVRLVSMSKTWFAGSMDGNSDLDQFFDKLSQEGILWVIAAGNFGDGHYMGTFVDDDDDGYHEFAPGDELMELYPKGTVTLALNWDAWEDGDQDYDLYVMDADGNVLASSENIQDSPDDGAYELIGYEFTDEGPYTIAFYAKKITRPGKFNFFVKNGDIEYLMPESSVTLPADSANVMGVGAVYWETDELEGYSGRGPTLDGRIKPDIAAPSVVSIAVSENPFNGTSAAAPHVAGAAALVWEAFPYLTQEQVRMVLQKRVVDLGPNGLDDEYGYGRLWLGNPDEVFDIPEPEETPQVEPTAIRVRQVTPTQTRQPIAVKEPARPSQSRWVVAGLGLACMALAGAIGLGGFGLLAVTLYLNRSRSRPGAEAAQAHCAKCGKPLRPGSNFCPYCGQRRR